MPKRISANSFVVAICFITFVTRLKKVRSIVSTTVWTLAFVYIGLVVALHVPPVQRWTGSVVASFLSKTLGTEVSIGRVDIGLLNRVVIDDVRIMDQQCDTLLQSSRMAASIELRELFDGRISLSSVQLFGMKAKLYQHADMKQPNFQFVIDSLSSGNKSEHKPLNLSIQSVVIRNGAVGVDFPQLRLSVSDLSAHAVLNALTDDSLNLEVRRLSLKERSGFVLSDMRMHLSVGPKLAQLNDFRLRLPKTDISIPNLTATFVRRDDGKVDLGSLLYNGRLECPRITIADISSLVPQLSHFHNSLQMECVVSGSSRKLQINNLNIASDDNTLRLSGFGKMDLAGSYFWHAHLNNLHISPGGIDFVARNLRGRNINLPSIVERLGSISYAGDLSGSKNEVRMDGHIATKAGQATVSAGMKGKQVAGHISTPRLDLGLLAASNELGQLTADLDLRADIAASVYRAKGYVHTIGYKGYNYRGIDVDATYNNGMLSGNVSSRDPNATLTANGKIGLARHSYNFAATVERLAPYAIGLTSQHADRSYSFTVQTNMTGSNADDILGNVALNNFKLTDKEGVFGIDHATLTSEKTHNGRLITLDSDVAQMRLEGRFHLSSLLPSLARLVGSRVPTMPGLPHHIAKGDNDFSIEATLASSNWLNRLFDIPLQADKPISLSGYLNAPANKIDMTLLAPKVVYGDTRIENMRLLLASPNDSITARLSLDRLNDGNKPMRIDAKAGAANNNLATSISFDNDGSTHTKGIINAQTRFVSDENGQQTALINILNSDILVGDTLWQVEPGFMSYNGRRLQIDNFTVGHGSQHLTIRGTAGSNGGDSILVDLNKVDVGYVLDLLNFHTVSFDGYASGLAVVRNVMTGPSVDGDIRVDNFRFQNGRMGDLKAKVNYDNGEGQINIDAMAVEGAGRYTPIKGYVNLKRNYIDLAIDPHGTNLEFIESFCSSFIDDMQCRGNGNVRVFGDLKTVNLEGKVVATGTMKVSPVGVVYQLPGDTITMVPDHILFAGDTILDSRGNVGILTGSLDHKHLSNLSYDLIIDANNLLSYDRDYDGNSFRGTVVADGTCRVRGLSGETVIDINATPRAGSLIEYNAAATSVDESSFIHWNTHSESDTVAVEMTPVDIPSDLRLNLIVNSNPDLTLRVLTDPATGDNISLNGSGVITASYFNKGAFQMFGNYNIDHGLYKLTIQNIIKREFQISDDSRIVFVGNPFDAQLNMRAVNTVNGVSLNDLQIGRSLTSNNVRVNCIMNITGTAGSPSVSFDMDIPSLSTDAKQMVRSVINSEEDMNQQVLYLLAVGRFQAPSGNNAQQTASDQSQTSLAMQSVLSGTLSQQINNVLSSFVKSDNWNFGANISTGDEGFNNAEYEGLLNGRLLNNRLLINGQFGYRDKAATGSTSFIGDFDIRYLIFPNGNLAVKVYNQTNDRYFTRNSLNTQGIGLIMKKDFVSWRDLLGLKPKKAKKNKQK